MSGWCMLAERGDAWGRFWGQDRGAYSVLLLVVGGTAGLDRDRREVLRVRGLVARPVLDGR